MATTDLHVPDDIARAVMDPASYPHLESVVLPACTWLRDNLPVGLATVDGWDPVWLVSRHADIVQVLRNQGAFHNGDFPHLTSIASKEFARSLTSGSARSFDYPSYMDPPEHPKVRSSANDFFRPEYIRKNYEPAFREFAKDVVDGLMARADGGVGEADFVNDFVRAYPLRVVLAILGLGEDLAPRALVLTREFNGFHDPANHRAEFAGLPDAAGRQWAATIKDLRDFFSDLRRARAGSESNDLVTFIENARIDGEPWEDRYADSLLAGILPAGHDTTALALSGGVLGLIRFPEQLAACKRDPSLIPGLVEECLRYSTPAKHFMRIAVEDVTVGDAVIKAGDEVMCLFASGNRDPRVFADPDVFDVTRRPNPHLTFSSGPHICSGIHIARIEMRVLLEELIPRIGTVELAGEIEIEPANLVSGLRTLPIRFTTA